MMTTWTGILLLVGSINVEVSLSTGQPESGELVTLTVEQVTIRNDGGTPSWPASQVRRVRFPNDANVAANGTRGRTQILLADGSRLSVDALTSSGDQASLTLPELPQPLKLAKRDLRSVLRTALSEADQAQWNEWLANPPTADVLVLQRKDKQLQAIEGVIEEIGTETVRFQFEGETSEVKLGRIVGMLFYAGTPRTSSSSRGTLQTTSGSTLQLANLELTSAEAQITTAAGAVMSIPTDQILFIDFAVVSTVYLSDLEPERQTLLPFLEIAELAPLEQRWFEPQRDRQISREPLRLVQDAGVQEIAKGLALHSRTELIYRLAGEYRRFLAAAAIDPAWTRGEVSLRVLVDGQERWQQRISAGEPAVPVEIDLAGANRLTILVDYGDASDHGDHLNLCDARLLK